MVDYTGQCMGSYRLLRILGQGSFADVYLGRHRYLKTEAAIKVLYGRLDAEAIEHFLTEAHHLRDLEHSHIIAIHDIGIQDDVPYLVMDYAPGGTLRDRYLKGQPLSLSTILSYVQQIASALSYAHFHRLIHRDLKPENLLLDERGEVLLSDFGVALPMRNTDSMSVQAVGGTLAYMAPEQIRGRPKAASDQYALGIMIYEWLTGQRPFHGGAAELCAQHLLAPPPSFYERVPGMTLLIEQVLFKALAKDPQERFLSVSAFAEALEQASRGEEPRSLYESFLTESPARGESTSVRISSGSVKTRKLMSLPAELTTLVGRDEERKAACVLLVRPEVRLLTMVGPGGIGKTQLSLVIAHDLQNAFEDGVCFVPLAIVRDSDEVLPALVRASGMEESTDLPLLEALKDFLRDKHLLLLFDNFEQVTDAAPLLMELLQACPDLTMLVTSRSVLHIPGEQVFPLSPLHLPDLKQTPTVETFLQYSSVGLFVQRAREARPDFQLTPTNAPIVGEICTQLDGLPLALELAAARIKLLSPQSLLSRLTHRLDLLSSTSSTMHSQRQQTIRNTIQWSYDLLTVSEQQLFIRLSVFMGGCGLADIEAFVALLGEDTADVFDTVTSLLDKSLLFQVKEQEEPRFQMLETLREFGLESLALAGELERVRAAHAAYYHSLLPEPQPAEMALAHGEKLALIKREYGNLRAALRTLQERQDIEMALQLLVAIGGIWFVSGYGHDGQEEFLRVLELAQSLEAPASLKTRAMSFYIAGRVAMANLDTQKALELLRESLSLARQLPDKRYLLVMLSSPSFAESDLGNYAVADALYQEGVRLGQNPTYRSDSRRILASYGISRFMRGELEDARQLFQRSLSLARPCGDLWVIAANLHYLGWVAYCRGSYEAAHRLGEAAMNLFRQMDFPTFALEALSIFAYETAAIGEHEQAQQLFEEALREAQRVQDIHGAALALCGQADLCLRRSHMSRARSLFEESIATIQKARLLVTRYRYTPACCLEGLAQIASAQEQWLWAARLLGSAEAMRTIGTYFSSINRNQPDYDRLTDTLRSQIGEEDFASAFRDGQRLSLDQVLLADVPEDIVETVFPPSTSTIPSPPALPASNDHTVINGRMTECQPLTENLTKREMEVLQLLAEAQSNAEIAENLGLSVVTVNSYLRSIYQKLGVSSRMRAVHCAREHHLLP